MLYPVELRAPCRYRLFPTRSIATPYSTLTDRCLQTTERPGFEPGSHLSAATRFPIAFFQPLRHLSKLFQSHSLAPGSGDQGWDSPPDRTSQGRSRSSLLQYGGEPRSHLSAATRFPIAFFSHPSTNWGGIPPHTISTGRGSGSDTSPF